MRTLRILAGAVAAALAGCGGGSSDSSMTKAVPFTSWSAVQPSTQVKAQGLSQEASLTFNTLTGDITAVGASTSVDTSDSNILYTFDANRDLVGIQVTTPDTLLGWSNQALGGGTVACSGNTCTAFNATNDARFLGYDPYAAATQWNYQSFGVWSFAGAGTSTFGAMTVGSQTPVGALPVAGSATYTGFAAGYYVDSGGKLFSTNAGMTATVAFNTRSIAFSTTNPNLVPLNGGIAPVVDLSLSGTLTYNSGSTRFSGTVTSPNYLVTGTPVLSGTATGRFYGPGGQEIGGVYTLRPSAGVRESMIGGFGGKCASGVGACP